MSNANLHTCEKGVVPWMNSGPCQQCAREVQSRAFLDSFAASPSTPDSAPPNVVKSATDSGPVPDYAIRKCRGHWHVTVCGEDLIGSYDSAQEAQRVADQNNAGDHSEPRGISNEDALNLARSLRSPLQSGAGSVGEEPSERTKIREVLDSIMALFSMVQSGHPITIEDLAFTKRLIGTHFGGCSKASAPVQSLEDFDAHYFPKNGGDPARSPSPLVSAEEPPFDLEQAFAVKRAIVRLRAEIDAATREEEDGWWMSLVRADDLRMVLAEIDRLLLTNGQIAKMWAEANDRIPPRSPDSPDIREKIDRPCS